MKPEHKQYLLEGAEAGERYRLIPPDEALRGRSGERFGQGAGSSLDFKDYRDYQPGDDLRMIDWGVYARSDKLTIKMFREEVSPHLDIVLDGSASMDLPESAKSRGLLGLSALFANAARNAQCSVTAWMQEEGMVKVPHGSDHPAVWDGIALDRRESPAEAFGILRPRLRNRGMRIFISDLLFPVDPSQLLRHLARDGAPLLVVQLLAAQDAEPPERGNLRLLDVESDTHVELYLDATLQARYREALATHQDQWRAACREVGAALHVVIAEELVKDWSLPTLEAAGILAPT